MKNILHGWVVIMSLSLSIQSSDFSIDIQLIEKERSKDSNQRVTLVKVEGRKVTYSYRYTGFPGPKKEKFVYKLSKELKEDLRTMLMEGHLDREVEEEKPSDSLGHSIELFFTFTNGPTVSKSHIVGMIRFMKTNESNLEETAFIDAIEDIISFIKFNRK